MFTFTLYKRGKQVHLTFEICFACPSKSNFKSQISSFCLGTKLHTLNILHSMFIISSVQITISITSKETRTKLGEICLQNSMNGLADWWAIRWSGAFYCHRFYQKFGVQTWWHSYIRGLVKMGDYLETKNIVPQINDNIVSNLNACECLT